MIAGIFLAIVIAGNKPPVGFTINGGNADDKIDSTCIAATALALKKADAQRLDNLLILNAFFIGRLSGRASDRDWQKTADRESDAELNDANFAPVIVRCGQRMSAILGPR